MEGRSRAEGGVVRNAQPAWPAAAGIHSAGNGIEVGHRADAAQGAAVDDDLAGNGGVRVESGAVDVDGPRVSESARSAADDRAARSTVVINVQLAAPALAAWDIERGSCSQR